MPQPKLDQKTKIKVKEYLETSTLSNNEISRVCNVSSGAVSNVKKEFNIIRPTIAKEAIDPTNEKILKLERQVLDLRDERSQLKRAYEAVQRKNTVFQALSEEIREVVTPISPLPPAPKIKYSGKRIQESLVVHLSDEHATDIVLPHQVGGLENFNFQIALRRAEVFTDSIIKFTQKILKSYHFHTCYILANGDHTSGEIHNASNHSEYKNIFRNCLATAQMQALIYRDLAPYFDNIKVVYTPGNHGRRSVKKDHNEPRDNWDYLVAEMAAAYCRDLVNIEFLIPDAFSINLEIEGHGFMVFHGDDIKSFNSIPWYGIERKTRRLQALSCAEKINTEYFCLGHFHTPADQGSLSGETIINGSWVATSPYVYNSMSTYTEPSQIIHGVHKDYGVSWRLRVKLRTPDEHLGPRRYSVVLSK